MKALSERTKIPLKTLYNWNTKLELDINYRPDHTQPKSLALKPEAEKEIAKEIHLCQTQDRTVANVGSDEVICELNAGPKECLTVMAAITNDGQKLPLMVLCKGKTDRCERKVTESPILQQYLNEGKLLISHSESGWTTEAIAIQFLQWMHIAWAHGKSFTLLWDVYKAHIGCFT